MSDVELRDHIEQKIKYERQWVEAQLAAIDKALTKAESSMSTRLEGMNEFRRQLEQQETRYAQRSELKAAIDKVDLRLSRLEKSESIMTGKTAMIWLILVLCLGIVGALAKYLP